MLYLYRVVREYLDASHPVWIPSGVKVNTNNYQAGASNPYLFLKDGNKIVLCMSRHQFGMCIAPLYFPTHGMT